MLICEKDFQFKPKIRCQVSQANLCHFWEVDPHLHSWGISLSYPTGGSRSFSLGSPCIEGHKMRQGYRRQCEKTQLGLLRANLTPSCPVQMSNCYKILCSRVSSIKGSLSQASHHGLPHFCYVKSRI